MKKLAGLLAGLCAITACLGGMLLSDTIYSVKAVTEGEETEIVTEADVQAEAMASNVMVSGKLQWTDDDGNVHPCRVLATATL